MNIVSRKDSEHMEEALKGRCERKTRSQDLKWISLSPTASRHDFFEIDALKIGQKLLTASLK
jgi:hypothetical protein